MSKTKVTQQNKMSQERQDSELGSGYAFCYSVIGVMNPHTTPESSLSGSKALQEDRTAEVREANQELSRALEEGSQGSRFPNSFWGALDPQCANLGRGRVNSF